MCVDCSHLSTGQEAVAVGIEHAISKEDNVVPLSKIDAESIGHYGIPMSRIYVHARWSSKTNHCRIAWPS